MKPKHNSNVIKKSIMITKKDLMKFIFGALLFMALLNPSIKDMKNFIGDNRPYTVYKKEANYLIFSKYSVGGRDGSDIKYYVGFMKNFWEVK